MKLGRKTPDKTSNANKISGNVFHRGRHCRSQGGGTQSSTHPSLLSTRWAGYFVGISPILYLRTLRYPFMHSELPRLDNLYTSQEEWYKSIPTLNEILQSDPRNAAIPGLIDNMKTGHTTAEERKSSWRRHPKYFSKGNELFPGITDIAALWFQAGHSVCQLKFILCSFLFLCP